MPKLIVTALAALAFVLPSITPLSAADLDLKDDLTKLQGKWKATVTTDEGKSNWTLEIKANKTKVLIERDGETVFKGESDFKLEKVGQFKAYTYFNLEVQSGSNAGEKLLTGGETRSSVYRLDDDAFITAGGFSEGDKTEPSLIKWTKVTK